MNQVFNSSTNYKQVKGYTIVFMVYDGNGENLLDTLTVLNKVPSPSMVAEFTPRSMDEFGQKRYFRVHDATSYTSGMDTLGLMLQINGSVGKRVMFPRAMSDSSSLKAVDFVVDFFKSVVVEFDLQSMRNRMLV